MSGYRRFVIFILSFSSPFPGWAKPCNVSFFGSGAAIYGSTYPTLSDGLLSGDLKKINNSEVIAFGAALIMADAGPDQVVCGVTTTNLNALAGSGTWSTGSAGVIIADPSSPTTGVFGLTTGVHTFTWTVSPSESDDMTVTVGEVPGVPAISSTGSSVCQGTAVTLSPTVNDPQNRYEWYKNGNPTGSFGNLVLIGIDASGDYQLKAINIATECESALSAIETVSIEAPPAQPAIVVNKNLSCSGDPITLSSSVTVINGVYLWQKPGSAGFSPDTQTISIDDPSQSGDYKVIAVSERGCLSPESDMVAVVIEPLPATPSIATTGNTICADGSQVVLTSDAAPGAGSYIWYRDGIELTGQTNIELTLSNANESGDYTVKVIDGNGAQCVSDFSPVQAVRISQLPSPAVVGTDQQLCDVVTATLQATAPVVGTGTWSNSGSASITDPNNPNTTVTDLTPGTYVFTWQVDNGSCIGTPESLTVEIFTPPSAAVAEADKLICDATSATITATSPVVGTGAWSIVSGAGSLDNDRANATTIRGLMAETETLLSWTVSNGNCPVQSDELILQVSTIPRIPAGSLDQQLCNATATQMGAPPASVGVGEWAIISGTADLTDPSNPLAQVAGLLPGEDVTLTWTVQNSCGSDLKQALIQNEVAPDIAEAGDDQDLCGINTATLTGSGSGGLWTVQQGAAVFDDPASPTTVVSGLSTGVNILRYRIEGSVCDGTQDDVTVNVYEEPSDAIAGEDQAFCQGETEATVAATPPLIGAGTWQVISGNATILDPTAAATRLMDLLPGELVLRWTVENGSCNAKSDDLRITVNAAPGVEAENVELCMGESVQLQAFGGDSYLWQPATGLDDPTIANPTVTITETTEYSVQIIRNNCTSQGLSVRVEVKPSPLLEVSPDTSIFSGGSLQLFASGAETYSWAPETGLDDPASASPVASPEEDTRYVVTGTNEFDCSATGEVIVTVRPGFELFVPDLFTPNGDQMNDILFVNTLGIKRLEFRIFDRTGREVFSTSSMDKGWDGRFNGKEQSMDNYAYFVVAETFEGEMITRKGSVKLVR